MMINSKVIAVSFLLASLVFCVVAISGCKSSPTNVGSETRGQPSSAQNIQLWIADKEIELRFKEFQEAKDLLAVFELANHTTGPLLYQTYSFTDRIDGSNFCRLAAKQTEVVKEHTVSNCLYANNVSLSELGVGESVLLAVPKWEVKETLNLSNDVPEITTRIGFEVFVGSTRQKQIVWSDEIVFPKTVGIASR